MAQNGQDFTQDYEVALNHNINTEGDTVDSSALLSEKNKLDQFWYMEKEIHK